jgi:tellurite resistance protein TerA
VAAAGPRDRATRQGCFVGQPWVWHQGDDRTGSAVSGETIFVNPQGIKELQRLVIYAFIFEGAAGWGSTDAVVTIKAPGHEVTINMGQQSDRRTFCALAELTFSGSNEVSIKKLMTFHEGHEDCDTAYGWGFRYGVGGK